MGLRLFHDVNVDDQEQQRFDVRRKRIQYHVQNPQPEDEQTAELVSRLMRKYDWMNRGAALALAKGGFGPESDVAKELARRSGHQKVKKGLGWHTIGDTVGSATRVGGALLQAGAETVDAITRDFASQIQEEGVIKGLLTGGDPSRMAEKERTTFDIAVQRWTQGKDAGLGSGILPDPEGEAMQEQARRAREVYTIPGTESAGTLGRITASTVFEPGTKPYNNLSGLVDMSMEIWADPAGGVLGAAGKAARARRVFTPETTGFFKTHRWNSMNDVVEGYLQGFDGRRLTKYLTETSDPYEIWRKSNRKFDNDTVRRLANSTDENGTLEILRETLGTRRGLEKPVVTGAITRPLSVVAPNGLGIKPRLERVRLLHMMPGTKIDPNDAEDAALQIERFMRNAKVDDETLKRGMNRVLAADGRGQIYNAVTDTMDDVATHLKDVAGVQGVNAKRLTKMWDNYNQFLSKHYVDDAGSNVPILETLVKDNGYVMPHPHLITELLESAIPLPDARAIRKVTSGYGRLLAKEVRGHRPGALADGMTMVLDFLSSDIWKPLVLLRPAWTLRVVGEEQVRMGAVALDSMIRHPVSAIAWAMGHKGGMDINEDLFQVADEVLGSRLDDFNKALSRKHGAGGWTNRVRRNGYEVVQRDDLHRKEQFIKGWKDAELRQLAEDPLGQRLAGGWKPGDVDALPGGLTGNHLEDAKRWFWEGEGKVFRKELGDVRGFEGVMQNQNLADDYVESVWERLNLKTGGDGRVMDGVAHNKLDDLDFDALYEEGIGPGAVKAELDVSGGFEKLNHGVDSAFNILMTVPTNFLSRSPTFRQKYWEHVETLLPQMTPQAQKRVIAAAKKANIDESVLGKLFGSDGRFTKAAAKGSGDLTLKEVDLWAKGYGLEQTKKLLYDMNNRSQMFDMMRIVAPFGEAWKEVATTWMRLVREQPQILRRGQQIVQGARQGGFFFEDENGEEVFAFSGKDFIGERVLGVDPIGAATEAVAGVPFPLKGTVKGLNLFSNSLLPGIGPIVQIPLSNIIPDEEEWQWARDFVSPYSQEGMSLTGNLAPAWLKKLNQSGFIPDWLRRMDTTEERLLGNTIKETAQYLMSTGKYDPASQDDMDRLREDAEKAGRRLYLVRGVAQAFAPSPPSPQFMAVDKEGDLITRYRMVERFKQLQDDDFDSAVPQFLGEFGENAFLFMQSLSEGGGVVTDVGVEWVNDHKKIARRYPETYAFFAPKGGKFDYGAYMKSFDRGERRSFSTQEFIELGNHRVAMSIYRNARDQLGERPNDAQRRWLNNVKTLLLDQYPGFTPEIKDPNKRDRLIRELGKAVNEPELADNPAAQAIKTYLQARDEAVMALQESGLSNFNSKRARPLRDWLRSVSEEISSQVPEFDEAWEKVFEREIAEDEE